MLHQLSLLASAPADLGRDGRGRLLSPTGSPVKRPSRSRADIDGLYPAAASGRCAGTWLAWHLGRDCRITFSMVLSSECALAPPCGGAITYEGTTVLTHHCLRNAAARSLKTRGLAPAGRRMTARKH